MTASADPFAGLERWAGADLRPALEAFRRFAPRVEPASPFAQAAQAALQTGNGVRDARRFFTRFFEPNPATAGEGLLTGYYEPVHAARLEASAGFQTPLYRRPADLAVLRDEADARRHGLDPDLRFARRMPDNTLQPYPDRAAIEDGFLRGRGLELAYLAEPVDAFFVHVQGSARLELPDGRRLRVGYDGKNGHRFTAIGRLLVAENRLPLAEADMDGLRRWIADHPGDGRVLMRRNRSFIFFRRIEGLDEAAGPVGAADVPLTPFGSLAVDPAFHAFGTPIFVDAPPLRTGEAPFGALVIAQDSGSAIRGRARGDLFAGTGAAAGSLAGSIRHEARFHPLRLRGSARP